MIRKEGSMQYELGEFNELGETYGRLPYSDFRKWTEEGDIYERILNNLPLLRLVDVRALSFLTYEKFDPNQAIFSPYKHNRYEHSITVSLISGEIGSLNDLPQQDMNILATGGAGHDISTVALGDATKKVDPKALNEEKHWWQSLDKKGQDFITKELGIKRETLDLIITNKGMLGQVLDIADRITYTMFDLEAIPKKLFPSATSHDKFRLSILQKILSDYPKIGNIYKEVGVDRSSQKVFFKNPKNLEIFLLLRAHLHSSFYLKPENQGRDLFVAKMLSTLYSRTDSRASLTPRKLRLMTDEQLLRILQKKYKPEAHFPQEIFNDLVGWHPEFREFGKNYLKRAKLFAEELKKTKNIVVVGIHECRGFDPATSYNVLDEGDNIVPFKEYNPEHALGIEEAAEETKRVYVFYADVSKESKEAAKLLKAVLTHEK